MHEQLKERVKAISYEQVEDISFFPETAAEDLEKAAMCLDEKMRFQGIIAVHGRGRRKSQIQKDKEHLEKCLEKQK